MNATAEVTTNKLAEDVVAGLQHIKATFSEEELRFFLSASNQRWQRLEGITKSGEGASSPTLLKVAVFLEFSGISTCIKNFPPRVLEFIRMYAVSGKELMYFMPVNKNRDYFLMFVRNGVNLSPMAESDIAEALLFHQPFQQKVLEVKEAFDHVFKNATRIDVSVISATAEPVTAVTKEVPVVQDQEEAFIAQAIRFGNEVHNLTDHAQHYLSDNVSDKDRQKLRDLVGQKHIYNLKNLLFRLCGETAFKQTFN
jgi:hypothetical protein